MNQQMQQAGCDDWQNAKQKETPPRGTRREAVGEVTEMEMSDLGAVMEH